MTYPAVPPRPHQLTVDASNTINDDLEMWIPFTDQNIFGQGATDISGNGRNAMVVDTSVIEQGSFIDADRGACFYQNTTTAGVQVGLLTNDLNMPLNQTDGFTTSIWVKHYTTDVAYEQIWDAVYNAGGTANQNYQTYRDVFGGRFNAWKKTGKRSITSITDPYMVSTSNTWYHLVTRCDNNEFSLWVDNVKIASNSNSTVPSLDDVNDKLAFGRQGPASQSQGQPLKGQIQCFRFWSRDLSDAEIGQLYNDPWVGSNYTATSGGAGGAGASYFKPIRWNKSEDGLNIRRL